MTNSFSVTNENLPQKFIHQYFKPSFENISYSNGKIIIKQNDIKIVIICVNTSNSLSIERLDQVYSNVPSYYILFNLGAYTNASSTNNSCSFTISDLINIDSSTEMDLMDRIENLKGFIESILNFDYHPKKIIIQKMFFSST